MASRAYWKGYLRLSLVSCPVALFPATSEREKVRFHQINKNTGNRVRYRKVDAETEDPVGADDIVKGYEVAKGHNIVIAPEELEAVAVESRRTIDIDQFVPRGEIDQLYNDRPYFIVPNDEVGQQAFAVIREAIKAEGMVALARVTLTTREHMIALEPRDKGIVGTLLRFPYELRDPAEVFEDIADETIPKDMLDLAKHIVRSKAGHFEPATFEDHYETALRDLLRKKAAGHPIAVETPRRSPNVVNLMDALRRSIDAENATPSPRSKARPRAAAHARRTPAKRSAARGRKAG